jgi:Plants and Prokaryotes Conserved (PCC) domain
MKTKLINDGPQKTYVLVLDKGDEAVSSIEDFARKNGIAAAQITGIGAFSDAVLGFFDWETKNYRHAKDADLVAPFDGRARLASTRTSRSPPAAALLKIVSARPIRSMDRDDDEALLGDHPHRCL